MWCAYETILVVEVAGAEISWMEPRDLPFGAALNVARGTKSGIACRHPCGGGEEPIKGMYTRKAVCKEELPIDNDRQVGASTDHAVAIVRPSSCKTVPYSNCLASCSGADGPLVWVSSSSSTFS